MHNLYIKFLKDIKGIRFVGIPPGTKPNYWFYPMVVEKQEYGLSCKQLMDELSKKNIQTRPVWHLNHLQRPYRDNFAYRIKMAFWFWERILNIPSGSSLSPVEIRRIAIRIRSAGRKR